MGSNLVLVDGSWVVQQSTALSSSAQALAPTFWGSGVDGALTLVGTYTQTYSLNLSSLTIPSGTIFKPNGYPTFVSGTTTIDAGGSYNDNGNNASGVTAGIALAARSPLDARSGAGSGGRTNSDGAGAAGGVASSAKTPRNALGVLGKGGGGGHALPGYVGSSGGQSAGTQIFQIQNFSIPFSMTLGYSGGAGGGGGSLDYDNVNPGTSGAGGSGAGIIWLVTKYLVNNGSISCDGGNGSDATSAGGTTLGGGGGGGQGGFVIITTTSTVTGSITANGGSGGLGANGGGTGSAGEVGNVIVHIYS